MGTWDEHCAKGGVAKPPKAEEKQPAKKKAKKKTAKNPESE